MAKITATQPFKHGHDTYEADTEYDVPVTLAGSFVMNGWATSDDPELADLVVTDLPANVVLEVDNVEHPSVASDA